MSEALVSRELFVRHAKRDGRSVAILRALDHGTHCTVEASVFAASGRESHPGPYRFADPRQATSFVTEAVESLMYLGCDVLAE